MNLKLANAALEWTHTLSRDANGRPDYISCPAHNGMTAQVYIVRQPGLFTCTCNKHGSIESDVVPCEAQENKQICYHILAALIHASSEQKCKIYFKYFEKEARELRSKPGNERARVIKIESGKAACYAVVFPPKLVLPTKKPVDKMVDITCPKCAGLLKDGKCIGHADMEPGGCGFAKGEK